MSERGNSMKKLNLSWLQRAANNVIVFGEKNAPSLLTGGSILLGWAAVYVFWKKSKKAEEEIAKKETPVNENEQVTVLPKKEKAIIYFRHCWPAALMGVGSTGLTIWAHEINLSRIAELYMLSQFLEGKSSDQQKLIDKLKGEVTGKKFETFQSEIREEKYPQEELKKNIKYVPGEGRTLFIDETMEGFKFKSDVEKVKDGIWKFNSYADSERERLLEARRRDAFFASQNNPFPDTQIYIDIPLKKFLEFIGETAYEGDIDYGIGDILVFRHYGGGKMCINPDEIMKYEKFIDPETGTAALCYLYYRHLLKASADLMDDMP